jgi:predicted nucleic acid-binding protein
MNYVIDANIAVALLVDLAYSDHAKHEIAKAEALFAPDLIMAETANAFWKIAKTEPDLAPYFKTAITILPSLVEEFTASGVLATTALDIALSHSHPAYDCLYLALAQQKDSPILTADKRLHALAQKIGVKAILVA